MKAVLFVYIENGPDEKIIQINKSREWRNQIAFFMMFEVITCDDILILNCDTASKRKVIQISRMGDEKCLSNSIFRFTIFIQSFSHLNLMKFLFICFFSFPINCFRCLFFQWFDGVCYSVIMPANLQNRASKLRNNVLAYICIDTLSTDASK